jgi:hypothetical protein
MDARQKNFLTTVDDMDQKIDNHIKKFIQLARQDQDLYHLVISRLDSTLALLHITEIYLINLTKQKPCATEEAEDPADKEATAAEETTLI